MVSDLSSAVAHVFLLAVSEIIVLLQGEDGGLVHLLEIVQGLGITCSGCVSE